MILISDEKFFTRLKHGWDAFRGNDIYRLYDYGEASYRNPSQVKLKSSSERSIVNSIYNRMAIDAASNTINHVRVNDDGQYEETIKSSLNYAISESANRDQTGTMLILDAIMSMFDEGQVAIVPIETSISPSITGGYDIHELRTAKILEWYPEHVKVQAYNQKTGKQQQIVVEKKYTAIIQNPLYSIMNEPNSTLQRLIKKLNLLDYIDGKAATGKLDIIMQLPFTIRSEAREQQAYIS